MSQELERVYTINLGKVKLSQSQHRAVRAINMIREFARHHMKVETIKIEEELAQQIWSKGVRSPPRKVRVRMTKTDEGFILVSRYDEEVESKAITESKSEKVVDEVEAPKTPEPSKEVEAPKTPEPSKEVEAPKTPEPSKEVEAPKTPEPSKEVEAPKTPEPSKEVEAPKTPEPSKEVEAPKTPEPSKEVEESSKEKPKKE